MIFKKKKTTVFTQCDMRMFQCKKIYYCWSMVSLLGLPFVKKKKKTTPGHQLPICLSLMVRLYEPLTHPNWDFVWFDFV